MTITTLVSCGGTADGKPADALTGVTWALASMGAERSTERAAGPTAVFYEGGLLEGDGGCNAYSARYVAQGEELSISMLGSTEQWCGDPDGESRVMTLEGRFLNLLTEAESFEMEEGTLSLRTKEGEILLFETVSQSSR